jgi:spore germination protein GerM
VEISRASGTGTTLVRRVTFTSGGTVAPKSDTVTLRAYFINAKLGSSADCSLVFPLDRVVPTKTAGYRAAIEALLKGPVADEKSAGYATSIPSAATLKSVAADASGIVTADFTTALDRGVAGSCRVSSVRAQIEKTLGQFPEVHGVVITVNGKKDTVLQP